MLLKQEENHDQTLLDINKNNPGNHSGQAETQTTMKFFARLNMIVLLAISALLYMAWSLPSYHPITRAKKVWSRTTTHLVVFGDSWSTNHLEPPATADQSSAPANKKLWVDALCSEVRAVFDARLVPTHSDPDRLFATTSTTSPNRCLLSPRIKGAR